MPSRSIFINTPLQEYFCVDVEGELWYDVYDNAVKAFRTETAETLRLFDNSRIGEYSPTRAEPLRGYIIKLLLYIGLLPKNSYFAVIARLIESVASCPEYTLESVIDDFADAHNTTASSVSRIIDKCLNVYDPRFTEKVMRVTDSNPMTSKDVLCDLAVHVRIKYHTENSHE